MKCTWIIRDGDKKVASKDVASKFREELLDAHATLKQDHDAKVDSAIARVSNPTDEDVLVTPVTSSLDREYYEATLRGYVEAERIETSRREGKMRTLGQIGAIVVGGVMTIVGMAFLDSCEKREDNPTQPMRHPGSRLLGRF